MRGRLQPAEAERFLPAEWKNRQIRFGKQLLRLPAPAEKTDASREPELPAHRLKHGAVVAVPGDNRPERTVESAQHLQKEIAPFAAQELAEKQQPQFRRRFRPPRFRLHPDERGEQVNVLLPESVPQQIVPHKIGDDHRAGLTQDIEPPRHIPQQKPELTGDSAALPVARRGQQRAARAAETRTRPRAVPPAERRIVVTPRTVNVVIVRPEYEAAAEGPRQQPQPAAEPALCSAASSNSAARSAASLRLMIRSNPPRKRPASRPGESNAPETS